MSRLLPTDARPTNSYPNYQVSGAPDFSRSLREQRFQILLATLMEEAGVKVPITIVGSRKVPGSDRTRGLHLGAHRGSGIVMTWHDPDKDNGHNIEVLVRTPSSVFKDTAAFYEAVNNAFNKLVIRQRVLEPDQSDPEVPENIVETEPTGLSENPEKKQAEEPQEPKESLTAKIDEEIAELIVLECAKRADEHGLVARRVLVQILIGLEYPSRMRGPAIKSLLSNGHFEPCEEKPDFVYIGARWREKCLPDAPISQPQPSTEASEAEEPQAAKEVGAEHDTEQPSASKPETLQMRIKRLQRGAALAQQSEQRLREIASEKRALEEIVQTYTKQIDRLENEERKLQQALESPDLKDAKEKLAAVTAALS